MSVTVRTSVRADRQATRAGAWWRKHRAARTLFDDELRDARTRLESAPEAPPIIGHSRKGPVRRILLEKSSYYVFYRYESASEVVLILSIWHTSRGGDPAPR